MVTATAADACAASSGVNVASFHPLNSRSAIPCSDRRVMVVHARPLGNQRQETGSDFNMATVK
jgi:hypothetical protein